LVGVEVGLEFEAPVVLEPDPVPDPDPALPPVEPIVVSTVLTSCGPGRKTI
jgi:hypothetical protein